MLYRSNIKVGLVKDVNGNIDIATLNSDDRQILRIEKKNEKITFMVIALVNDKIQIFRFIRPTYANRIPNKTLFETLSAKLKELSDITFKAIIWGKPDIMTINNEEWFTLNQQPVLSVNNEVSVNLVDFISVNIANGDSSKIVNVAEDIYQTLLTDDGFRALVTV